MLEYLYKPGGRILYEGPLKSSARIAVSEDGYGGITLYENFCRNSPMTTESAINLDRDEALQVARAIIMNYEAVL